MVCFKRTLLFFCLPALLWAGTTGKIAGVVKDAGNKEPLPGVNLIVEGTSLGAVTSLTAIISSSMPPGRYNLRATMMGYTPVIQREVLVQTDHTTTINFNLSSRFWTSAMKSPWSPSGRWCKRM